MYDNEKSKKDEDILKDIEKGVKLKRVKTNDRSKPNLRGSIESIFPRLSNRNMLIILPDFGF